MKNMHLIIEKKMEMTCIENIWTRQLLDDWHEVFYKLT